MEITNGGPNTSPFVFLSEWKTSSRSPFVVWDSSRFLMAFRSRTCKEVGWVIVKVVEPLLIESVSIGRRHQSQIPNTSHNYRTVQHFIPCPTRSNAAQNIMSGQSCFRPCQQQFQHSFIVPYMHPSIPHHTNLSSRLPNCTFSGRSAQLSAQI